MDLIELYVNKKSLHEKKLRMLDFQQHAIVQSSSRVVGKLLSQFTLVKDVRIHPSFEEHSFTEFSEFMSFVSDVGAN